MTYDVYDQLISTITNDSRKIVEVKLYIQYFRCLKPLLFIIFLMRCIPRLVLVKVEFIIAHNASLANPTHVRNTI